MYNNNTSIKSTLLLLVILATLLQYSSCLFVKLSSGRAQCFMEDLNENTQVIVGYKLPLMKTDPKNVQLKVEVSDPFGNVMLQKNLEHWDAVVPFKSLSQVNGVYEVCFQAYLARESETKMEIRVDIDDDAKHYEKLESKDRLENINGLLEKLKDKISYIQSDQSYFKSREERFRETSDCIDRRVFYFGFLMSFVLLACGAWQVTHLKSFFKQKKLA